MKKSSDLHTNFLKFYRSLKFVKTKNKAYLNPKLTQAAVFLAPTQLTENCYEL